jgi:hypothetical protein
MGYMIADLMLQNYYRFRPYVAAASHGTEFNFYSLNPPVAGTPLTNTISKVSDIWLVCVEIICIGSKILSYLPGYIKPIIGSFWYQARIGGHLLGAISSGHIAFRSGDPHMHLRCVLNICNIAIRVIPPATTSLYIPLAVALAASDLACRVYLYRRT